MRKSQGIPAISAVENQQQFEDGFPLQVKLLTSFFFLSDFFFFLMWAIFKVFVEFVAILVLFLCGFFFFFFWLRGMCDLSSLARNQACTACTGR